MEFPGLSKKKHVEFSGLIKNEVEFPRVTKKNYMWTFQGSLFLALEFARDVTQFFGISRAYVFFCLEFPWVK